MNLKTVFNFWNFLKEVIGIYKLNNNLTPWHIKQLLKICTTGFIYNNSKSFVDVDPGIISFNLFPDHCKYSLGYSGVKDVTLNVIYIYYLSPHK